MGITAFGSLLPGCSGNPTEGEPVEPRLTARPGPPTQVGVVGKTELNTGDLHGVIYVPPGIERTTPAPLLVFLHGALRTVDFFVDGHRIPADSAGVIVMAPYASVGTWDAIQGNFGPDVAVIDRSLQWAFDRWTIDPARIILTGFSDGGTYTLAMGRANGDLFSRLVAYSPGFLIDVPLVGRPPVLITHGTADTVLPVDVTSRRIVPALRTLGYTVDYREFDGPHAVPLAVVSEVVQSLGASNVNTFR